MSNTSGKKKTRRKPGGQPNNANARRHGFYSSSITSEEHALFLHLTATETLDSEMALFRVRFNTMLQNNAVTPQAIEAASKYLADYYRRRMDLNRSDTRVIRALIAKLLEYQAEIAFLRGKLDDL